MFANDFDYEKLNQLDKIP